MKEEENCYFFFGILKCVSDYNIKELLVFEQLSAFLISFFCHTSHKKEIFEFNVTIHLNFYS